ncbi:MAG: glycosyltransferase N-terminal domain-containing protein [Saprospiraceae bacterium]
MLLYLFVYNAATTLLIFLNDIFNSSSLTRYFDLRINQNISSAASSDCLFHCASYGEYLSIKPLLLQIKKIYPKKKITISFLSPSGYENAQEPHLYNSKIYCPVDSKKAVFNWLKIVDPSLVIIAQNEVWPMFLSALGQRKIPFIYVESYFNENLKNKIWLKLNKLLIGKAERIFVQNQNTASFLKKIWPFKVDNVGSLRQEHIKKELSLAHDLQIIKDFKDDKLLLVLGSTHIADFKVIGSALPRLSYKIKLLIAPHDISDSHLNFIDNFLKDTPSFRYSEGFQEGNNICILDQFGVLKYTYQYADIVYIGGGFGKGIHNVLEPAFYETPIIVGTKYRKFAEALLLEKNGELTSIKSANSMIDTINTIIGNQSFIKKNKSTPNKSANQPSIRILQSIEHYISTGEQKL